MIFLIFLFVPHKQSFYIRISNIFLQNNLLKNNDYVKCLVNNQFISKGLSQLLLLSIISKNNGLSGYQIVKRIKELTDNNISLKIGSIYPQLDQLEQGNYIIKEIESVSESTHMQKAVYSISKQGIKELQRMVQDWSFFIKNISELIN